MNKTILPSLTIFCLLLATMFLLTFVASGKAGPDIIHVPSDYAKIQWAIGNASAGDTIMVSAGIYYEHLIIDKSLTILGENRNTIIDGNGTGHVVTIYANNVNVSGFTIRNSGPDFWESAIYVLNSNWCNISHNTLIHSGHGIWIHYYSNNNILTGNNISHNLVGIDISISSNNTFTSNYVFSSTHCGIGILDASNNIIASNIAKNNEYGVYLGDSANITVTGNTMTENLIGIGLYHSDNNTIFHNNIINNTCQAITVNSTNTWYSDYEGNYWSDYDGLDADQDGIGDTAYMIDANNTDNYPLMGTFSDFAITWEEQVHHVTTICNSTISNFNFESKAISFNVTGEDGTSGFCRIRIPTALMNDNFTVYVDGVITPYTLLPRSNATYNYLYLTYIHSTKNVTTVLLLVLVAILTVVLVLVAIIIKKRKTPHT